MEKTTVVLFFNLWFCCVSTAMNTVVSPVLLRTHQRSTGAAGIRSETCKMNVKTLWFEFFKKERQLIIMWLSQQVG